MLIGDKMINIILLCAGGMSSSLLMKKVAEAAEKEGIEISVSAHGVDFAKEVSKSKNADIILIAPQVRYMIDKVKKEVTIPVALIEMKTYGLMNGKAIIDQVKELLKVS